MDLFLGIPIQIWLVLIPTLVGSLTVTLVSHHFQKQQHNFSIKLKISDEIHQYYNNRFLMYHQLLVKFRQKYMFPDKDENFEIFWAIKKTPDESIDLKAIYNQKQLEMNQKTNTASFNYVKLFDTKDTLAYLKKMNYYSEEITFNLYSLYNTDLPDKFATFEATQILLNQFDLNLTLLYQAYMIQFNLKKKLIRKLTFMKKRLKKRFSLKK